MTQEELREKARTLPLVPGVYLMQDKSGDVIYVGKAKKLRNRVSQYFVDSVSHTVKTRKMVSQVDHFDVIVARSEFEALVLECSLIKRHMPKYNILLKDDKGYPYVRVDLREDYPTLALAGRALDDGAAYFGPFGGRYMTQHLLDTLRTAFRLPGCGKKFPRDQGKARPCLNFHMNLCDGWCRLCKTQKEYYARMEQVVLVLQGKHATVSENLKAEMEQAAEALDFERAAELRDRLKAVAALGEKQFVTAGTMADTDVVGYSQNESCACFTVLHYVGGNLLDKDYEILPASDREEAVSSLVKQYYLDRHMAPKQIFLPEPMEDSALFEELLLQELGKRVHIRFPQRGDGVRLAELARRNADEELSRATSREERLSGALGLLRQMLGLPGLRRIEAYDISHIAGTDIVASLVVFVDGKPKKSDYKRFKLENMEEQDDYGAMRQVLLRRFIHYQNGDQGFDEAPDLLLIDGGAVHAGVACGVLRAMDLSFPVYGMVKDDRHRTRALVTAGGEEIGISTVQSVFAMVGTIQEETHRFAITYHKTLRSRRMRQSELDGIPGIGEKRKTELLRRFGSVKAIRAASLEALSLLLPKPTAEAVYRHFHPMENKE
ncbi:MAG: excinuclease ABC subunit UvrC [Oscillospiraceae bacterium]|nr:excinuclease ABC subunit UvrC [Oscillospiraceae bacterium]